MRRSRLLARALAILWLCAGCVGLVTPATVEGAIYEVNACRLPNGAPAPARGWVPEGVSLPPGMALSIACPGGSITGIPGEGAHPRGVFRGAAFEAPPNTTIAGYTRSVTGVASGESFSWAWLYGERGKLVGSASTIGLTTCFNCGPFAWVSENRFRDDRRLHWLAAGLQCDEYWPNACSVQGARFDVQQISVMLEDLEAPEVLSATGSLLEDDDPHRGMRALSLRLYDAGGGLYKAFIEVDGKPFLEQFVDQNGGACRPPFVDPVPCKLTSSVHLPIATDLLPDGNHQLRARVVDATGINGVTYGPVAFETDNIAGPPPLETAANCPARTDARLTTRLRRNTIPFGHANTIIGRASGLSRDELRGSTVSLLDNARLRTPAHPRTVTRTGRFQLRVRPAASHTALPVLRSSAGTLRACGKPVRLVVRAGLRFSVAPRALRNGASIVMTGVLRALPGPPGGKSVAIQARARGRPDWTTATILRTDPQGRFRFKYRFRRTFARTVYEFRALAPRERSYPYARGWSQVTRVTVRP
jgi:hypothetical protein